MYITNEWELRHLAMQNGENLRKKLAWVFIFILVAAASVWAVANQSDDFTVTNFIKYISNASPIYMMSAVLCMIGYICFEGCALLYLARSFGYNVSFRRTIVYSASDIYVSAITPSASGGQPAAAYFMFKDGIPVAVSSVILFLNISVYAVTILTLNILALIIRPEIFFGFDGIYRLLILFGFFTQTAIVAFFIIVIKFERLVEWACSLVISILCKIRLVKNREKAEERINQSLDEYRTCAKMLANKKGILPPVLLFNFLQRMSLISVIMFTYLATHGGDWSKALDVWFTQTHVFLGANSIPIPGAVGVTDALILNGFRHITNSLAEFELLGRSISFYCCVLICGIIMFAAYINVKRRDLKKR